MLSSSMPDAVLVGIPYYFGASPNFCIPYLQYIFPLVGPFVTVVILLRMWPMQIMSSVLALDVVNIK